MNHKGGQLLFCVCVVFIHFLSGFSQLLKSTLSLRNQQGKLPLSVNHSSMFI